jgi:hypothetical protein
VAFRAVQGLGDARFGETPDAPHPSR